MKKSEKKEESAQNVAAKVNVATEKNHRHRSLPISPLSLLNLV